MKKDQPTETQPMRREKAIIAEVERRLREAVLDRDGSTKAKAPDYIIGLAKGKVAALDDLKTWLHLTK